MVVIAPVVLCQPHFRSSKIKILGNLLRETENTLTDTVEDISTPSRRTLL